MRDEISKFRFPRSQIAATRRECLGISVWGVCVSVHVCICVCEKQKRVGRIHAKAAHRAWWEGGERTGRTVAPRSSGACIVYVDGRAVAARGGRVVCRDSVRHTGACPWLCGGSVCGAVAVETGLPSLLHPCSFSRKDKDDNSLPQGMRSWRGRAETGRSLTGSSPLSGVQAAFLP